MQKNLKSKFKPVLGVPSTQMLVEISISQQLASIIYGDLKTYFNIQATIGLTYSLSLQCLC